MTQLVLKFASQPNGDEHLSVEITDTAGRTFSLSYDTAGHLTQLTDPIGRTLQYAYDAGVVIFAATGKRRVSDLSVARNELIKKGRKIREAARQVNVFFATAQAMAADR